MVPWKLSGPICKHRDRDGEAYSKGLIQSGSRVRDFLFVQFIGATLSSVIRLLCIKRDFEVEGRNDRLGKLV